MAEIAFGSGPKRKLPLAACDRRTSTPASGCCVFASRTSPEIDPVGASFIVDGAFGLFARTAKRSPECASMVVHFFGACAIVYVPSSALLATIQFVIVSEAPATGVLPLVPTTRPLIGTP